MARFLEHSASRFVDGKKVGEGSIPSLRRWSSPPTTAAMLGEDSGAPVSPDYGSRGNAFNGRVKGVQPSRLAQYSLP
jgi:arylsulfatase